MKLPDTMSARRNPRKNRFDILSGNVPVNHGELGMGGSLNLHKPPRSTPRNSVANDAMAAAAQETPYDTLRSLASIIPKPSTPLRRASSAGPSSTQRSPRRTPAAQIRTPGIQRPGSTRRPIAVTPHARAAMREIELRRAAALTPGNDRRRSGRQQRETPRDLLRQLSKVLAVGTQPIEVSPLIEGPSNGKLHLAAVDTDLDVETELVRPRLSIPLGDDEDDDSLLLPPHSASLMDDDNYTQRSVELPRRANSEQSGRLSRGSFGSIRTSDRFGDLNENGMDAVAPEDFDPSYIQGGFEDEDTSAVGEPTESREVTGDFGLPFPVDGTRRASALSGRISDIRASEIPVDDTETTFVLPLPEREQMAANSSTVETPEILSDSGYQLEVFGVDSQDNQVGEIYSTENFNRDATARTPVTRLGDRELKPARTKKMIKVSKHGIPYSSLPAGVVKKVAATFLRTSGNGPASISKDTLQAIMQASDWFFEQVSDDLGTYAKHAGRKTIDENDVVTLMKRQRQTSATTTPFALAQRYLPRELLQDLRMAPTKLMRVRQAGKLDEDQNEDE